ncbi:hypothetical protein N431DRAFT_510916 [Stipitochalara longipes BDJ]|nr:hypothetical protein N431DRAFT_510916 [Stipitochalara longipes BDJ]
MHSKAEGTGSHVDMNSLATALDPLPATKSSAPKGFNAFLSEVTSMQATNFAWKTLFEAKDSTPKAPYDTEPSSADSTGDTDIEPGPLITKAKADHEAMLKKRALILAESSTPDSKRKGSSFEDCDGKPKNPKRRALAKKNATSSGRSSQNQPPKFQVKSVAEVAVGGFRLTKILAKGWQTPLAASKSCWCYLVEWEEDATTGTKAGDTTWEPVNSIKKDQGLMVDLFESRMLEESRKGPPTWKDVKVSLANFAHGNPY